VVAGHCVVGGVVEVVVLVLLVVVVVVLMCVFEMWCAVALQGFVFCEKWDRSVGMGLRF